MTIRVLLLVIVVLGILVFLAQDGMIYFPRPYDRHQLDRFANAGGIEFAFETSQGEQVAFYLPPKASGSERVWIVSGGNGALALDYMDILREGDPRHAFLFIDFPGYGKCEGSPTPKRVRENTSGAIEALAEHLELHRDELGRRIGAFGHSIGCAAVLRAAADFEMERAVLVAPFTTMMDMARRQVGTPLCHVLKHRYDNRESLREIAARGGKVVAFHGSRDRHVPVSMSRKLAEEFPEMFTLHEIKGGDHNAIVGDIRDRIVAAMAE